MGATIYVTGDGRGTESVRTIVVGGAVKFGDGNNEVTTLVDSDGKTVAQFAVKNIVGVVIE